MGPRFDSPVLLANGTLLKVEGPFETYGEVIGDVTVRFLIMGDGQTSPILGTATLANAALNVSHPASDVTITRGRFSETVPNVTVPNSPPLKVGDKARGIGLAVALKQSGSHDPPAFETFTWCVTLAVN
jgi:hypothetical protein